MGRFLLTREDIEKLEKNKYVAKASETTITYTFEFKRLFIDEYIAGKPARKIFAENGFDIAMIGIKELKNQLLDGKKLMIKVVF